MDRRNDRGRMEIYLDIKDQIDLRYLMEHDHLVCGTGKTDASEATDQVISACINKLWDVLDNLELFSKYESVVVVSAEGKEDVAFDWQGMCDKEGYRQEANTEIWASMHDFMVLEACLRRTMMFVTNGRVADRDEMIRIALRFRTITVRFFRDKKKNKEELGIRTPNGLAPIF